MRGGWFTDQQACIVSGVEHAPKLQTAPAESAIADPIAVAVAGTLGDRVTATPFDQATNPTRSGAPASGHYPTEVNVGSSAIDRVGAR